MQTTTVTSYSGQQIIAEINAYMTRIGKPNGWYVGITSDIKERLFGAHKVSEQTGAWVWLRAHNAEVARAVEKAYLDAGHDGGTGGGDDTAVCVYAYLKTSQTEP